MNKYAAAPIVLGLSAGLVLAEVTGESNPHAEFVAVSPAPSANIAFTNTAAATYDIAVRPEDFAPAEWKIPHDQLVIQTAGLLSSKK